MSELLGRREFCASLIGTVLTHSLITSCSKPQGVSTKIEPIVRHWAIALNELCSDLRLNKIPPEIWQEQAELLFSRVKLDELLRFIDFESLIRDLEYPDLGVANRPVAFPGLDGLPEDVVFIKKIFGLKRGRAIIPHGHSNMASGHLILKGKFDLRNYDKVDLRDGNMIIRPTVEKTVEPGDFSTVSDERDNVHWFVAGSDHAFTFDVIMLDLGGKKFDIHNLDIGRAERQPDGNLRARIIGVDSALKKYGKIDMH